MPKTWAQILRASLCLWEKRPTGPVVAPNCPCRLSAAIGFKVAPVASKSLIEPP
jgi:hypothetical protein